MWHHHYGVVVTSSLIQMDGLYDKYGLHVYPSLCVHICERMKITQRYKDDRYNYRTVT